MSSHDMASHPDEEHYEKQYWHWLEPELRRLPAGARVLDIGCGQGRLTLPIARMLTSSQVTGVDLTEAAVDSARQKAGAFPNVEFQVGDALEFVSALPSASHDLIVMTEVSFFMPRYREVLIETGRVLKDGGLLFASFRSQYFNLLHSVRERDWTSAQLVRDQAEGEWGGTSTWFSWQTPDEILAMLVADGFALVSPLRGIGIFSGIVGDPLATIAQPSRLSHQDRERLLSLEISLSESYPGTGRYVLAVARKNPS